MALYTFTFSGPQLVPAYPALLSWMEFDKDYSKLTIFPDSKRYLGPYMFYSTASKSLLRVRLDNITIYNALIKARYVDSDGFLTSDFDPDTPLLSLDAPYDQMEGEIREMLRSYYIEIILMMTVKSSLELQRVEKSSSYIQINTKSQFNVKVTITLFGDTQE